MIGIQDPQQNSPGKVIARKAVSGRTATIKEPPSSPAARSNFHILRSELQNKAAIQKLLQLNDLDFQLTKKYADLFREWPVIEKLRRSEIMELAIF